MDSFCGEHFVSLVGFRFLNMAVKGVPAVGFRDFPEVNLRFYVCRNTGGDVRRGVVFIREMTPHRLVEWVAQRFYNEPYRTLPMRYQIEEQYVSYEWKLDGRWQGMSTQPSGEWNEPPSNSNDTFFIEHYWGYSRQHDGGTLEYEVTHPKWQTRPAELNRFDLDLELLCGAPWAGLRSVTMCWEKIPPPTAWRRWRQSCRRCSRPACGSLVAAVGARRIISVFFEQS
mgnify:CR=1 FL=1